MRDFLPWFFQRICDIFLYISDNSVLARSLVFLWCVQFLKSPHKNFLEDHLELILRFKTKTEQKGSTNFVMTQNFCVTQKSSFSFLENFVIFPLSL